MSVKYITKNIKTDSKDLFLAAINQITANPISSRNLRLIATRMCRVWLSGPLLCPLRKMEKTIIAVTEKSKARKAVFPGAKSRLTVFVKTKTSKTKITSIINNPDKYLINRFKRELLNEILYCRINSRKYADQ